MPSKLIDYATLTPSESRLMRKALRAELEVQMGHWEDTEPLLLDDGEAPAATSPQPSE